MIVHEGLAHEILWVAVCIGKTSPSHSDEISVKESSIHLQYYHVLVDTGLSPKGRLEYWFILDLPIEVVD